MNDVSLNGWPVLDDGDPRIATGIIPSVGRPVTCARAALPVFLHFYAAWQKEMGPRMSIKTGPIDGHEVRQSRAAKGYSNHASGTAVDVLYNTVLPADGEPHMTAAEKANLDKILSRYVTTDGHRILANGEWWRSPHCDGMHTENSQSWDRGALRNTTAADVANVIKRLGIKPDGTTSIIAKIIAPIMPKPKPPVTKGAAWCSAFLTAQGLTGATHRIVWTLAGRESGWDASMVYPAGKHDWASEQPPFDVGFLQCNSTHLPEIRTMFGPSANMKAMLDAGNCFRYSAKLSNNWTNFTAWGIGGVNADGTVRFDWAQYPQAWLNKQVAPGVTQQQESEQAFLAIWKQYVAPNAKPTPAPKPVPAPKPKPSVSLAALLKHDVTAVKSVQAALNKVVGTTLTVDGLWGPKTQAAYDKFRSSSMGLSGNAANGTPGVQSLTALGKAGGFLVVK